jgi:hypothetical protein
MATYRLQPVITATTAQGTATGLLTLGTTVGITRHSVLLISHATGGWKVEVDRVIDATKVLARQCGFTAMSPVNSPIQNPQDLTVVPNGADVTLPEQWVSDLYVDDLPDSLSLPTK